MTVTFTEEQFQEEVVTWSVPSLDTKLRPAVSVIVPVYNGEDAIEVTMHYLERVLREISDNYELIFVNDGSSDNTRSIIQKAQSTDSRIVLLSYRPNMGKGFAVKQGVLYARGENIVFIDGDCEIDPFVLSTYLNALKDADIVVASKYHPDSRVKAPLLRKILSFGFHILVRIVLGIKIRDTQAGLKAGRASAFKQIFTKVLVKRYAFDAEMLTVASLLRLKIVEMPIDIELNKHFKTREIARMFVDLAAIAYRLRIMKWYQKNLINDEPEYKPLIRI